MKVLRRILVFLVLPFLGYLICATVFNHFYDKVETGDVKNAPYVAVAKSCERHGPVAWRGFGYYYKCQADVRSRSEGVTRKFTFTGWLGPEDIGKEYAANTTRRGRDVVPEERADSQVLLAGLGTMVVGTIYLFAYANVVFRILPDRKHKRRMPTRYEPPAQ